MPPAIITIIDQFRALWERLSRLQRIGVAGGAAAAAVVLVILLSVSQRTDMAVAFKGLTPADAADIVTKLKETTTPYELADGGKTIRVPVAQVDDVRLTMVQAGLPKGGQVGYELFNQGGLANLGMTEFQQRLSQQRALEGELARTIGRIETVEQVRVHLVLPKDSLLVDRQREPTASVVLKLKGSELQRTAGLDGKQVLAIRHLLSRSVEGLKSENIAVVDSFGVDLTALADDVLKGQNGSQISPTQVELQRSIEREVQRNIQAMLEQALGQDRAIVRVTVALNWDQVKQNSEFFVPPPTVPEARPNVLRSEQTTSEKFTGPAATLPGGVPGAPSNIGDGARNASGALVPTAPIAYDQENTIRNYEISKTVEELVKAPGAVERMSVGVMLDGPMEPLQVQAVERIVSAAAGVKTERGDTVTVASMPFDRTVAEQERKAMADQVTFEFYYNIAKVVAAVLISLFVLIFLRSMVARPTTAMATTGLAGSFDDDEDEYVEDELDEEPFDEEEFIAELEEPIEIPEIASPEEDRIREMEERLREAQERRAALEEQVLTLGRTDPEKLADLIKSWLEDDEEKP